MNYPLLRYLFGMILLIVAAFLVLPLAVAVIYGESSGIYFLYTMIAAGLLGFLLTRFKPAKRDMYAREGFVFTALAWVVISLIGAAPFTLSGQIPSYLDAVFETVSGFTTTGASILTDVEALDNGMLFWRSFTHWLGGMGILVFMLSLVNMGGQANHLLRAESPGPTVSKMVPNMRKSAAILYGIYIVMTAVEVVLLLIGGMPLFDSLCTAFGTAGTGGFGIKNSSMGYYDSYYLQGVVSVFMALFGVNFNVYFFLLMKKYAMAWRNTEVRAYFAIIAGSTLIITLNILGMFPTAFDAFHHAFFAVSSVITTTGFSTTDFDLWPQLSRCILVLLMYVGGCAGSTAGGMKISRLMLQVKSLRRDYRRRRQGFPAGDSVQSPWLRAAQAASSPLRAGADGGRKARQPGDGAGRSELHDPVFSGDAGVRAAGGAGQSGFCHHFHRRDGDAEQHWPRSGTGRPHGLLRGLFAAGEDRPDGGYAVRAAGAVPHADPAHALDLAEILTKTVNGAYRYRSAPFLVSTWLSLWESCHRR